MVFHVAWLDTQNDFHASRLKRIFRMLANKNDDTVTLTEMTPGFNNALFLRNVQLPYYTRGWLGRTHSSIYSRNPVSNNIYDVCRRSATPPPSVPYAARLLDQRVQAADVHLWLWGWPNRQLCPPTILRRPIRSLPDWSTPAGSSAGALPSTTDATAVLRGKRERFYLNIIQFSKLF